MRQIEDIIEDIKLLYTIASYPIDNIGKLLSNLKTEREAKFYINLISQGGKPETAISDYLFKPLLEGEEYLDLRLNPQMKAGNGWVDYLIGGLSGGNPVAIELKPLHEIRCDKITLSTLKTDENQIKQYLRSYDYVLLTNMRDVHYYNREAMLNFEPFLKEDFLVLVEDLRTNRNIWDVVRRKEDRTPKHELDKKFFTDLTKWYEEFKELEFKQNTDKDEKVVQLINKFIFVKTLEDFSLIPFNFLRDCYEEKVRKWKTKGNRKVFREFFDELNRWCYEYYDTELFKGNIYELIIDSDKNIKNLQISIEKVLGLSAWSMAFGIGLVHYNYRSINEDIFGKAYETFLAEERKEQGIYYTSAEITEYVSSVLIQNLFKEAKEKLLSLINEGEYIAAEEIARKLIKIRIIDPACGSGSFLIKTLKNIWSVYSDIEDKTHWATIPGELLEPDHIRIPKEQANKIRNILRINSDRECISLAVLRHLFGIDRDEKAIDVAKVNIWKEAIKLSPKSFKYDTLPETANHILPDLELNFAVGNTLIDLPLTDCIDYITKNHAKDIATLHRIRNRYIDNPFEPQILDEAISIKTNIRENLYKYFSEVYNEKDKYKFDEMPVFIPLEFFFSYFNQNGSPLDTEDAGFEGVIGNPPWENIKPIAKEFAAKHPNVFGEISKFSLEGAEFEKIFNKALKDGSLRNDWESYRNKIQSLSDYIRDNYILYGSGDISYQKVFLEKSIRITRKDGVVAILVPSGFHTDEGQINLRKEIVFKNTLLKLMSFENRRKCWFKDIDPRFKFDSVIFKKAENEGNPIETGFYIHSISEITQPVMLSMDEITKLSPTVLGFFEFKTPADKDIALKIRGNHPLIIDHGYKMLSELHITNDNSLFNKGKTGNSLILYEGKMINQYTHKFSEPKYWVSESKGMERLLGKEIHRIKKIVKEIASNNGLSGREEREFVENKIQEILKRFETGKWKLDYEVYRLAYRAIASSTNERTMIATIIPKNAFTGNSINVFKSFSYSIDGDDVVQKQVPDDTIVLLLALLNSFVMDYYLRLKVSANLTTYFIDELPVPNIKEDIKSKIISFALKLLPEDIASILHKSITITPYITATENEKTARAKLEALIARDVYGLTIKEMEHILDSFVFGDIDTELKDKIRKEY